ncbi:DUF968 domain-containing protein [Rouxiella badensis]|uniref:DUF968 domain-containing protein n=1 Tax=Rouxiella badensis TaxID=1646377 RepID=UPI001D136320|nr:DUF968 domain-containing protein [Rouxiella badensis]MCC3740241.1 DUF968 domain-containing protein [Rouxiella badensis]
MRALLKPYPQRDLGIVLLRPPADMLQHFSGKRLLITDEPADLRGTADGLVPVEAQPLSREPRLAIFLTSEPIINLVGGWDALTLWVKRNRGCQCIDFGGQYHHHELVQSRRGRGVVSLCWSHDNEYHGKGSVKLDAAAWANATEFVSEMIRARSRLPAGHQLTLPELCWWAISNGLASHLPEEIICEALGMRYRPPGEQMKESDINPGEREPREVLASNIKPVLALMIDPEAPKTNMKNPKPDKLIHANYTRWIKKQPCCGCGNQADDPHHITGNGLGGMGMKASDFHVIPLCRRCHDALHADTSKWEEEFGSQADLVIKTQNRAIALGVIFVTNAK